MQARRVVLFCISIGVFGAFLGCVGLVAAYLHGSLNHETLSLMLEIYAFLGILLGLGALGALVQQLIRKAKQNRTWVLTVFSGAEQLAFVVLLFGAVIVLAKGIPALLEEPLNLWPCIASGVYIYIFRTATPDSSSEDGPHN
jgi:hypothetical protein